MTAFELASRALAGVGSPSLGQWVERSEAAVHIRRRLSAREAALVNPLRDVRGTPEERERLTRLLADAPHLGPVLRSRGLLSPSTTTACPR